MARLRDSAVGCDRTRRKGERVTPLGGARVLLVEDNEINQQIAGELLEGAGAERQRCQ